MKLEDYELLPGIIIDADDPERRGRVKASVPTWFDLNIMSQDAMPWIYPFTMSGYQTFTKLENGRKIWVLHNNKNYDEYWYLPMFELNEDTRNLVNEYDDTEVLISRLTGDSGNVYVYYNDHDGIMLSVGDTKVNVKTNQEIEITNSKASLKINGDQVHIGNDDGEEYLPMGKKLKDLLTKLAGNLITVGTAISSIPFVSPVGANFVNMGNEIQQQCTELLSKTVKISK